MENDGQNKDVWLNAVTYSQLVLFIYLCVLYIFFFLI